MPIQSLSNGHLESKALLPPVFIAECDITWYGISLWSFQVSVPSPSVLALPNIFAGRWTEWVKQRESLHTCKHCSAITKRWECYQHCSNHKSKTHTLLWRKLTPPLPDWVHEENFYILNTANHKVQTGIPVLAPQITVGHSWCSLTNTRLVVRYRTCL